MELIKERVRLHVRAAGHGKWLEKAEKEAEAKLKAQGLRIIKPLHGGAASIVLLVEDTQGEKKVAKIMPPEEKERQSETLRLMGGQGAPSIISEEADMLLIQYISGQPQPRHINPAEAAELIRGWDRPARHLPSIKQQLKAWLKAAQPKPGERPDIKQAVDQAEALLKKLPGGDRLLHGDLGYHNLIQNQKLWAIDPTGASGPIEADIAFMSFLWPGREKPEQVEQKIRELCASLDGNPELAEKYALVRAACSAGFGNNRGEEDFSAQSPTVVQHLNSGN